MYQTRNNTGMTLIELMVAIAIMTVITAGAFKVYTNLQSAHERILKKAQALSDYQRFYNLLEQDLKFALNRTIRPAQDSFGGSQNNLFPISSAAFTADESYFQLTRNSGLPNLTSSMPQSELRRVAYAFDDGKIYRYQWGYVDPGESSVPAEMNMLNDIELMTLKFGYLPSQNTTQQTQGSQAGLSTTQESQWQWLEQWLELNHTNTSISSSSTTSSATNTTSQTRPDMPQVLEITLDTKEYGSITRVFAVGAPDADVYSSLIINSRQSTNTPTNTDDNSEPSDTSTAEDGES